MSSTLNQPLVSVVLRTYERPKYVERALESVINQTYSDIEVILIDDHSMDETPEILSEYDEQYDYIEYIRNDENQGHVTTLNIATEKATGKYVAFLDDDDRWFPKKLEAQVNRMEELDQEYGLVYGSWRLRDMDTGEITERVEPGLEGDIYWEVLKRGSGSVFGPPSAVMIRDTVFEEMGYFDEDYTRGAGQKYFRQIAKEYKVAYTNVLCTEHYVHDDRITNIETADERQNAIRVHKQKLEDMEDDLKQVPEAYFREINRLANLYLHDGNTRKGRQLYIQCITQYGISPKILAKIALTYLGSDLYFKAIDIYSTLFRRPK